jgi:hypothetical protein
VRPGPSLLPTPIGELPSWCQGDSVDRPCRPTSPRHGWGSGALLSLGLASTHLPCQTALWWQTSGATADPAPGATRWGSTAREFSVPTIIDSASVALVTALACSRPALKEPDNNPLGEYGQSCSTLRAACPSKAEGSPASGATDESCTSQPLPVMCSYAAPCPPPPAPPPAPPSPPAPPPPRSPRPPPRPPPPIQGVGGRAVLRYLLAPYISCAQLDARLFSAAAEVALQALAESKRLVLRVGSTTCSSAPPAAFRRRLLFDGGSGGPAAQAAGRELQQAAPASGRSASHQPAVLLQELLFRVADIATIVTQSAADAVGQEIRAASAEQANKKRLLAAAIKPPGVVSLSAAAAEMRVALVEVRAAATLPAFAPAAALPGGQLRRAASVRVGLAHKYTPHTCGTAHLTAAVCLQRVAVCARCRQRRSWRRAWQPCTASVRRLGGAVPQQPAGRHMHRRRGRGGGGAGICGGRRCFHLQAAAEGSGGGACSRQGWRQRGWRGRRRRRNCDCWAAGQSSSEGGADRLELFGSRWQHERARVEAGTHGFCVRHARAQGHCGVVLGQAPRGRPGRIGTWAGRAFAWCSGRRPTLERTSFKGRRLINGISGVRTCRPSTNRRRVHCDACAEQPRYLHATAASAKNAKRCKCFTKPQVYVR